MVYSRARSTVVEPEGVNEGAIGHRNQGGGSGLGVGVGAGGSARAARGPESAQRYQLTSLFLLHVTNTSLLTGCGSVDAERQYGWKCE